MRKKRIVVMCAIGVTMIALLLIWKMGDYWRRTNIPVPYVDRVMGIAVVEDLSFLKEKEWKTEDSNPGILFENTLLSYDAGSNTLFLPQSIELQEWVGKLSAKEDGFFLCTTPDSYWQKKQDAIREGHSFPIWLVNEECYYELNLVMSGMPVITIDTESKAKIQGDEELVGIMRVFNPGVGSENYEIHQSYVSYRIKGATSRKFDKKGYTLKLQDYRGEKVDASLLGMRSDNSWKLNALYTDPNRIREKTAAQIWEEFSNASPELKQDGARLEYVELVINNEYEGLYCLVEPVDEDKLELDKDDVLYKVVGWEIPDGEAFATSVAEELRTVATMRINYPKTITDYANVWYPMQDYNERFYLTAEMDYQEAVATVNVDNLSDVLMFLAVTYARDNHYKNLYFVAEVSDGNQYVMKQIPWDLDYTFGNVFSEENGNLSDFIDGADGVLGDSTLPRLKYANLEEIGPAFWERWTKYRSTFLSVEYIGKLLQDNMDYLVETGAMERERIRWPEDPVSTDIEYLLDYQERRMEWLDNYFYEWSTQ